MVVGNGYIGVVLSSPSPLLLRQGRALSVPLHFYPVVEVFIDQHHEAGENTNLELKILTQVS